MKTSAKLLLIVAISTNSLFLTAQNENVSAIKIVSNSTGASTMSIKGDKLFCTTSNYTIENLPKGSIVHWKVFPLGIAAITSPDSRQTTLNKISDGDKTLTAIVTYQ
jgi:hypothetical protein